MPFYRQDRLELIWKKNDEESCRVAIETKITIGYGENKTLNEPRVFFLRNSVIFVNFFNDF